MDYSAHAVVLEDLKFEMRTWFSKPEVQACRSDANSATHALAKLALQCNGAHALTWEYDYRPAVVADHLVGDKPTR